MAAVLAFGAPSAVGQPAPADASASCGLVEAATDIPFPPPDYEVNGGLPVSAPAGPGTLMGTYQTIDWSCRAEADPVGPVGRGEIMLMGSAHPLDVSLAAGTNISMQFSFPRTGGAQANQMVPFRIEMDGSLFVDPASHTGTVASSFVTQPLNVTDASDRLPLYDLMTVPPYDPIFGPYDSIQHFASMSTGKCRTNKVSFSPPLFTETRNEDLSATPCSIPEFIGGVAPEDVVYQFQWTAGAGARPPNEELGTFAMAWGELDPIISIVPGAEFAPGMRYEDFYDVEVSSNVVMSVPEAMGALQLLGAIAGLACCRRQKTER